MNRDGRSRRFRPVRASRGVDNSPRVSRSRHLLTLYEVGRLLVGFETVETTVTSVLTAASATLSLRSAILVEDSAGPLRKMAWSAPRFSTSSLEDAARRVQEIYAALDGGSAPRSLPPETLWIVVDEFVSGPAWEGPGRFITLPLVAERNTRVGVLQLEGTRGFDESDIAFVSAVAGQLTVALDRYYAWTWVEESTRRRDELIDAVTHDLKNPLSTILLSARLGLSAPHRADAHLHAIRRSAERMESLVHDLLDAARIDAQHLQLVQREQDLSPVVEEAVRLLGPLAADKKQVVVCAVSPDLRASIDADRLYQVVSNLVGNAIKFTPHGGRIEVTARQMGSRMIEVSIADTGPGIPEEERPYVFDRFWQAKRGRDLGTGLGLSIAKGIVEAHGGTIDVRNQSGGGATFSFTLPSLA